MEDHIREDRGHRHGAVAGAAAEAAAERVASKEGSRPSPEKGLDIQNTDSAPLEISRVQILPVGEEIPQPERLGMLAPTFRLWRTEKRTVSAGQVFEKFSCHRDRDAKFVIPDPNDRRVFESTSRTRVQARVAQVRMAIVSSLKRARNDHTCTCQQDEAHVCVQQLSCGHIGGYTGG